MEQEAALPSLGSPWGLHILTPTQAEWASIFP